MIIVSLFSDFGWGFGLTHEDGSLRYIEKGTFDLNNAHGLVSSLLIINQSGVLDLLRK